MDKINGGRVLLLVIVALLLFLIFKRQEAPNNVEMLEKLNQLDSKISELQTEIKNIEVKREEVKTKINDTKTSIKKVQSDKMVINSKPYNDEESLKIISDFFRKRGIK